MVARRSSDLPFHRAVIGARTAAFTPMARALLVLGTTAVLPVSAAWAQAPAAQAEARRSFDVPAGRLDQALTRFGRQAAAPIAVNADLTTGLHSPGVSGSHTVTQALQQLLEGTGLQAVRDAGGEYTLRKAAPLSTSAAGAPGADALATLPSIRVKAASVKDGTTEGTGSYTTRAMDTATKLPLSIRETPQSVSVITRQRMADQGLTQLTDVVQQTPGLTIAQSGNAGSDSSPIYSRGFQVENYQVDGVGHLHSNYSSIFQTNDMVLYDRVEVVRGATGLMNGIGTPSATINLIRKKPTAELQGYVKAEVGSWNRARLEADASTALNDAKTVRGRGVLAWQDNDSYIDRLHERRKIAYGVIEADLTRDLKLTTGLTWQHTLATGHSRGGLPVFNTDGTPAVWRRSDSAAASWAYSDRENIAAFAALEQRFDNGWRLKGTYSYDRTRFDEMIGYATGGRVDPATGSGVFMYAGRWAGPPTQHSLDVSAGGPFELFGRRHDLALGATVSHTKQDTVSYYLWNVLTIPNIYTWNGDSPARPANTDAPVGDFDYTERTRSAYATARFKPIDPLSIIVGARTTSWNDHNYQRNDATGVVASTYRDWKNQLTPYAGVVFDVSKQWSLYANYTDIFKPQSFKDASGAYLDPLLGKSIEVGSKAELFDGRLNLAAALYQAKQDNLGVSLPGVLAPDGSQAYRAANGTKTRGFEVELGGQLARQWQASAAFSRNMTKDASGALLNTNVPQNTFKLFSTYKLPGIGNGLTLGGGVRWQNRTWSDFPNVTGAPRVTQHQYAVVDVMARYEITPQVAASFNAYNLFDQHYHTNSSSSYWGEPLNFRASLAYRF